MRKFEGVRMTIEVGSTNQCDVEITIRNESTDFMCPIGLSPEQARAFAQAVLDAADEAEEEEE